MIFISFLYSITQISRFKARGRSREACRSTKILLSSFAGRSSCHGRLLDFRKRFPCTSHRLRRFGYRSRGECSYSWFILRRKSSRTDQFEKDLNNKRGNQQPQQFYFPFYTQLFPSRLMISFPLYVFLLDSNDHPLFLSHYSNFFYDKSNKSVQVVLSVYFFQQNSTVVFLQS